MPIDRYVDWNEWGGRFDGLRRVLKGLQIYRDVAGEPQAEPPVPEAEAEKDLARRAASEGYSSIRAPEVARVVPDLLIGKLVVEGIPTGQTHISTVDVYVENVAYPARLAPGPLVFRVSDRDGTGVIELAVDPREPAGPIRLRGSFSGLPAGAVSDALSSVVPITFNKGTMNVSLTGTAGRDWIDLTAEVRCVDLVARPRGRKKFLTLRAGEVEDAFEELKELSFRLIVRGDPRKPRVRFIHDGLGKKLKDAALRTAKRRAAEKAREQRERLEQKAKDRLHELLKDKTKKIPDAGKMLEDIFRR